MKKNSKKKCSFTYLLSFLGNELFGTDFFLARFGDSGTTFIFSTGPGFSTTLGDTVVLYERTLDP